MKGVLLAGGRGTRLRPITNTRPKQLVPVANSPVIQYGIEAFREAGITEIGVVLGNKGRERIQRFLGDGSEFGVDITYIVQGNPLGLSHAVGCARAFVGSDDFVLYLGDNIFEDDLSELVTGFANSEAVASVALGNVDNPQRFGVADVDDQRNVTRVVEKPDDPPSSLAVLGVYAFSREVFDAIERLEPSWRGELEITDAIQLLLEDGLTIRSHVVDGWWMDVGKPEDVLEANRHLLETNGPARADERVDESEIPDGVEVHESATVEDGTVLRGPISIAGDTTIGDGASIGPYTSIGPGTTVRNAHIENSVIIGDSKITTENEVVNSLLGRGSTVKSANGMPADSPRLTVGENSIITL
ncbi:glucose-1-phosphate thymidylyltransferase [Halostagnicola sp. A-GB9-2]|uniref:glucose-1-phosphate thymidylyltransferase n=1 Tax=Halostagnicola sp. A-GB9-2 TaxID=3048066 RepID=UPI0024BFB8AA|nr:glucose-1-phosphate thymidylyltransferase [Halostagnicola sp. A-GB9-2]MDJ1431960.1 glucose-1-phosphate thymidylyltransferase [Halostagnicola sp. A-GB9-2]